MRFTTSTDFDIVPKVQIVYADMDFDSFVDQPLFER